MDELQKELRSIKKQLRESLTQIILYIQSVRNLSLQATDSALNLMCQTIELQNRAMGNNSEACYSDNEVRLIFAILKNIQKLPLQNVIKEARDLLIVDMPIDYFLNNEYEKKIDEAKTKDELEEMFSHFEQCNTHIKDTILRITRLKVQMTEMSTKLSRVVAGFEKRR